jgi:hypothetical protein
MILPKFAGRGLATGAALAVVELARNAGLTNLGECEFEYPKGHWMRCNDWRIDLFANQ